MRIGQSIDIHQLKQGRPLILGGVSIEHEKGLDGHSDADVFDTCDHGKYLGCFKPG